MTNVIQSLIEKACRHEDLTRDEAEHAFQIIMNGGATPAQMAAFLVALKMKGETASEITGGAYVLRAKADHFNAPENALDTCGTGGDMKGTLNISTAVAIVLAACGVPIIKHGNRSISSKSGSSDVLAALGVDINASKLVLEKALTECNLAFLMAPNFHKTMRHVAPIRQELGMRTIFNLLGPLSNPAKPKRQVLGVYARPLLTTFAHALKELGSERAWVVHGSDGLDELTITGESYVAELKNGEIREWTITPKSYGLAEASLEDIKGEDALYNAQAIHHLLAGKEGAYRNIVLLNAAAGLVVANKAPDMETGIHIAAQAIDRRVAQETLAKLIAITNEVYDG